MTTINSDETWNILGKENPYYGVLTQEKYLTRNLNEEHLKDFFATGVDYVDNLFEIIHKHFDQSFNPQTILDFGCGTGRLLIPFAKRCKKTVGIDISEDILAIAKQNAINNHLHNIELYLSDDKLTNISNHKFDLINSYIVFQHINVSRGKKIMQLLLKLLNTNGICSFHLTYYKDIAKHSKMVDFFRIRIPFLHNFLNLIDHKPFKMPLLQMNSYDLNFIFRIIQESGVAHGYIAYTKHGNDLGVQLVFQKK
ncbi:MAG TPA: class I SAM-dependent methyltransferase [Bacteroidales bacterium]|nr:class I SAM-dependent methyltransferase [Bacteroidales bacterium]